MWEMPLLTIGISIALSVLGLIVLDLIRLIIYPWWSDCDDLL